MTTQSFNGFPSSVSAVLPNGTPAWSGKSFAQPTSVTSGDQHTLYVRDDSRTRNFSVLTGNETCFGGAALSHNDVGTSDGLFGSLRSAVFRLDPACNLASILESPNPQVVLSAFGDGFVLGTESTAVADQLIGVASQWDLCVVPGLRRPAAHTLGIRPWRSRLMIVMVGCTASHAATGTS